MIVKAHTKYKDAGKEKRAIKSKAVKEESVEERRGYKELVKVSWPVLSVSHLYNLAKGRDQSLGEPEAEDQLGTGHQKLGSQALEERGESLVLHHVGDDPEAGLGVLEVAVLDTGLDHVQGSGDDERGASTAHGGDEVLGPRSGVVVLEVVDVFLGESRATEELK
jgi:hypothetical protein